MEQIPNHNHVLTPMTHQCTPPSPSMPHTHVLAQTMQPIETEYETCEHCPDDWENVPDDVLEIEVIEYDQT